MNHNLTFAESSECWRHGRTDGAVKVSGEKSGFDLREREFGACGTRQDVGDALHVERLRAVDTARQLVTFY